MFDLLESEPYHAMSIELVQFQVVHYAAGDEIRRQDNEEFFENELVIGEVNCREKVEVPEPETGKVWHWRESGSRIWIVENPVIHFIPTGYLSATAHFVGVESEVDNTSLTDVFLDYLPSILELSLEFGHLQKPNSVGYAGEGQKTVTVLTAWNYSWHRSYDGEVDTEAELIGAVPFSKISTLVKDSEKCWLFE